MKINKEDILLRIAENLAITAVLFFTTLILFTPFGLVLVGAVLVGEVIRRIAEWGWKLWKQKQERQQ